MKISSELGRGREYDGRGGGVSDPGRPIDARIVRTLTLHPTLSVGDIRTLLKQELRRSGVQKAAWW
jgi:hypothetical protein